MVNFLRKLFKPFRIKEKIRMNKMSCLMLRIYLFLSVNDRQLNVFFMTNVMRATAKVWFRLKGPSILFPFFSSTEVTNLDEYHYKDHSIQWKEIENKRKNERKKERKKEKEESSERMKSMKHLSRERGERKDRNKKDWTNIKNENFW